MLAYVGKDVVIGDDGHDFSAKVADLLAEKKIVQAVGCLGREHCHASGIR